MSFNKKSMPISDKVEKKEHSTEVRSIDVLKPRKPRKPTLSKFISEHLLSKHGVALTPAVPETEGKIALFTPEPDTLMLYKSILGGLEIPLRIGAQVLVSWTSATTQGSSYVWSPLASAQFTIASTLFSEYTIDQITFDWQFPWTSTAAVVGTFMIGQDPDAVSTSLTETEIINFPGYEAILPATGAGSGGGHVHRTTVGRSMLLAGLAGSSISNLGGWSPVGSAWGGQLITIARNINATAPGTETFARVNQVWHLRFRNRFA